jgi:hypothetical protein
MKLMQIIIVTMVFSGMTSLCHARCSCDDWVSQGGYCVDYVKERIPEFPVPKSTAEIAVLKNRAIAQISAGDVAIFKLRNYWHVSYVEKVYFDAVGNATAIDMSEMNFGGKMSFNEYKSRWKSKNRSEWERAVCCGVTDNYDEKSVRRNVPLNTVTQVWSPDSDAAGTDDDSITGKARDVLNHFFSFTGITL